MAPGDTPSSDSEGSTGNASSTVNRRKFLTGVSAASVVAFAGCGGGGGGNGGDGGDGGGSGDGGDGGGDGGDGGGDGGDGGDGGGTTSSSDVADSVAVAAVEGSGRLFKRLMDNYVIDDTGIEVSVELFPYANLFEKNNSVLSTKGTAYDIIFMDDPWFPKFSFNLDPVQQWLPSDLPMDQLIQTTVDIATWPTPGAPTVPSAQGMNQKLRGQVIVGNTQLFAYNKKYYEEVGASTPPKTWQDVLDAGKAISEQIDGANGYIIRGKRGNPAMANFFALGNAIGGTMFDKNWRYQWAGDAGLEAWKTWSRDLRAISPEGVTSFDSDAVLSGLSDGSAAQAPAWPSAASLLLDPEKSDQAKNIEFTVIPKGHAGAKRQAPTQGNWIMGINSYVKKPKKRAAGQIIRSAISKEAQDTYVDLGGVPFRHDTFKNNMDQQPWFEALYQSLQTAQWRPRTPLYSEFGITHGKILNTALTGDLSPSEGAKEAKSQIEKQLKSAGYYK